MYDVAVEAQKERYSYRRKSNRVRNDRLLYQRTKQELACQQWKSMQNYADVKSAVAREIMARADRQNS